MLSLLAGASDVSNTIAKSSKLMSPVLLLAVVLSATWLSARAGLATSACTAGRRRTPSGRCCTLLPFRKVFSMRRPVGSELQGLIQRTLSSV